MTEADRARRAAWDEIWAELELGEHYVELRHNSPAAERILCICRGGNCRSVAAAFLLKYKYRRDAISCSIEKNDRYTIRLLSVWADRIFSFTPEAPKIVAAACGHNPQCIAKVTEIDIGEDTYANPLNVELLKRVDMELKKLL